MHSVDEAKVVGCTREKLLNASSRMQDKAFKDEEGGVCSF